MAVSLPREMMLITSDYFRHYLSKIESKRIQTTSQLLTDDYLTSSGNITIDGECEYYCELEGALKLLLKVYR